MSSRVVGNDFVVAKPRLRPAVATPMAEPILAAPVVHIPVQTSESLGYIAVRATSRHMSPWQRFLNFIHHYSLATFAVLILLVGAMGIQIAGSYMGTKAVNEIKATSGAPAAAPSITGLNQSVPTSQLEATLYPILNQAATITVGEEQVKIGPDTIKDWLAITYSPDKSQAHIQVKPNAIAAALLAIAQKYVKAPVNAVTTTYADGTSKQIAVGKNGTQLTDPDGLKLQAAAVAKTLMDSKGVSFSTPLATQEFASVTPAAFDKLIEVNIVTKQMYLYDKGQLTKTYPISAGAPSTPTPIGQYKIFSKLPVQDMKGFNPDGSKYFQPHVRWISYFLTGGYAVHGNYWRDSSWFGNINSSHGCVSLPDAQAKEVYDWSPIGTTVITHN